MTRKLLQLGNLEITKIQPPGFLLAKFFSKRTHNLLKEMKDDFFILERFLETVFRCLFTNRLLLIGDFLSLFFKKPPFVFGFNNLRNPTSTSGSDPTKKL